MALFGGRRAVAAPFNQQRPIVASASRIRLSSRQDVEEIRQRAASLAWQEEAWDYYDSIGEIKFAFGLVASVLSRLRLYPAAVVNPEEPPVSLTDAAVIERPAGEDEPGRSSVGIDPSLAVLARDVMYQAFSKTSMADLMRAYALNISVPGECYLLQLKDEWSCRSTSELRITGTGRAELRPSGLQQQPAKTLPKSTPIGRVWRQHPRYSNDSDSSMRALLGDCEELLLGNKMVRSIMRSRLSAGILCIADTVTVSATTPTDNPEIEAAEESTEATVEGELTYAMTEPIKSETSATSVVPLLLRIPGDMDPAKAVYFLDPVRANDEKLLTRLDRTLERILQGLDVPKDIVTGLANVKYSNAIQIDENLYKAHIEPLALTLVDALTEIIYQPLLRAKAAGTEHEDSEDLDRLVIWYDPSEITTDPDSGESADTGYESYLLSGSAWRRARGYAESDAPDEEELARRVALERATVSPEVAGPLFQHLLPSILTQAREQNLESSPLPPELTSMLPGAPTGNGTVAPPAEAEAEVPTS